MILSVSLSCCILLLSTSNTGLKVSAANICLGARCLDKISPSVVSSDDSIARCIATFNNSSSRSSSSSSRLITSFSHSASKVAMLLDSSSSFWMEVDCSLRSEGAKSIDISAGISLSESLSEIIKRSWLSSSS
uniref:Putative secreted protein n=1 Tax=Panstrongylus lignarius TaxID=156445 RepID=A0A224Y189_9HEMI